MYALGNVRASQGRYEESLKWHLMAYEHFGRTSGANHHRTADVGWRLAEHYLRLGRFEDCMLVSETVEALRSTNMSTGHISHTRSRFSVARTFFNRSWHGHTIYWASFIMRDHSPRKRWSNLNWPRSCITPLTRVRKGECPRESSAMMTTPKR